MVTDTESEIIREILAVTAVVNRYIRAVTANDEAAAAQFTCRKKDGSLLWLSSAGRPITLRRITGIHLELATPSAWAVIQVEGKPESPLTLEKRDDTWCIWP